MNTSIDICPICEEGHLEHKIGSHSVEYHGQHTTLDIHFSICSACGSEQAGADELRKNKRTMVEYRKKVDGLLTGTQVRVIRKRLGLSQSGAARVFGGGPVAFSKYENDDIAQSDAMDKLLRLADKLPDALEHLQCMAGMDSVDYNQDNRTLGHTSPVSWDSRLPQSNETRIAYGVDACTTGWFCIAIDLKGTLSAFIVEKLEQLITNANKNDQIFVDIPIGLSNGLEERQCDKEARSRLGRPRQSSVFPVPARASLSASSREEAKMINQTVTGKSLSIQTLAIIPKIKEVDVLMRTNHKARSMIREVHPEICFWALAGGKSMEFGKKTQEGFEERLEVLNRVFSPIGDESRRILRDFPSDRARKDDILDAMSAAVTASVCSKELQTIPNLPTKDSHDLPMEMVYYYNREF